MSQEIFVVQQMGDALRNTGYKNIESAVSEIIDNSIEANANDIFILVSESVDADTGRKYVSEIAFLDNGSGMDLGKLQSCLGIGYTTRYERRGMGRFGVGLPQASLHVCPCVDVYSWQNGYENCHKVYLDINKVKTGEQKVIDSPVVTTIPEKYLKFLSYRTIEKDYKFSHSGTLVHWRNCDRVSPKTIRFLFQTLEFSLGQKFRYLIKDGTHNIKLIHVDNEEFSVDVMPNDPLFLMKPNYVLGNPDDPKNISPRYNENCTEPLFAPYTNDNCSDGVVIIPVNYTDRETGGNKESTVTVKFSVVRNLFYDKTAIAGNPGGTPMGKHVAKMEGISVVRAGREIDFGMFDFYENINEPQHRWWGCEINFMPELDEAFGVANNKQHVELRRLNPDDYSDEIVKPMWLQLYTVIHNTIRNMYSRNEEIREKARTVENIQTPATTIINIAEQDNEIEGETAKVRYETPPEVLTARVGEVLREQGIEEPTEEDISTYMNNKVNIVYKDSGRGPFFDYSFSLGSCLVTINTSHIFYQRFLSGIIGQVDTKVAFELFIASLVKTIEETNIRQGDANDVLVQEWNNKLRKYINEQNNFGQ